MVLFAVIGFHESFTQSQTALGTNSQQALEGVLLQSNDSAPPNVVTD
jgi:hypothetical protein